MLKGCDDARTRLLWLRRGAAGVRDLWEMVTRPHSPILNEAPAAASLVHYLLWEIVTRPRFAEWLFGPAGSLNDRKGAMDHFRKAAEVGAGLGRVAASHPRASASYQIR